ncbi:hypothetical protein BX666DRAFT_1853430 [Dichotomocladium elegans]|nr:hypothetical protein BX666DRAFT_1853430 [Dichotomocladium elegans]
MATSAQTALTDVIGPSPAPLDYYYYHHHYRHPPQPPTPTRPPPPPPPATVHRKRRANDEDNSEAPEADSQPEFSAKRSKKLSTSGNHRRGTPIVFLEQHPHQQQPQPQPQQQDPPHHTLQQHPLFLQQQHLNDGFQANPSAVPRRQKLRYEGDEYTPKWVRFQGQLKEGYCDHCKPGKWLQLKNSAYWYHKQFFHGISSVSGKRFAKPLEQRASENDGIEGLCHQCRKFVPICNAKRKTSVLWYRHAHKCHVYDKPKPRLQTQVAKRNGKNQ